MAVATDHLPRWTIAAPAFAALAAGLQAATGAGWALAFVAIALLAAVLAAVHHAEVIAARVGEPFGTLLFAVAVTVIEVGLCLLLGVNPTNTVLLALTLLCATLSLSTGRTTVMQGALHLCLFAIFLFMLVVP